MYEIKKIPIIEIEIIKFMILPNILNKIICIKYIISMICNTYMNYRSFR